MSAYERLIDAARGRGYLVKETGPCKAKLQCGHHSDSNPSVSVTGIETQALIHCHAGCDTADVLAAYGLTMADLFDDRKGADYRYPGGRVVHRKPDKSFPQSGNKTDTSLFRADRIGDATTDYVVEGEKDVLAIESAGGVAVCPPMGAGQKNLDQYDWTPLRGKHAIIVADKDKAGRDHARQVAKLLNGIAESVRIVEAAAGKDAADHIAAGHALDQLVAVDEPEPIAGTRESVEGMPRLWDATDLKPAAQARWLAKARLLMAAINLLIGDEGIGKSLLWVWVVSAFTTGRAAPEFGIPARSPARVIVVCTEDDWTTDVRPRLEVAGADLAMIQVICTEDDGSGAPTFPRDLFLIAEADPAPALVVVDAWLDTVPTGLSVKDPQQARQALHPWKELATSTSPAVLLLCHTNRVDSANARDRYGVTGELRKKARMTLYAQQDDDGNLVVGPEKMNAAAPIPASKFTIKAVQHFTPTIDHDGTVPQLVYAGESDMTAREHLAENHGADHGPAKSDAIGWLATYLAAGPRWASDAHSAREEAGFSEKTVKTTKRKLGVESERDTANGPWFWRLPQHNGVPEGRPQVPGDPSRDAWTSGTSGPSGPLLETFQKSPFTSQDSQRANGETRGTPGPSGCNANTDASDADGALFGEPATNGETPRCDCGNRLVTPVAIWTGKCTTCRDEESAA